MRVHTTRNNDVQVDLGACATIADGYVVGFLVDPTLV